MKTYIAIPSRRDWKPHFGASLCGLVRKMTQDGVDFDTMYLRKLRTLATRLME